MTGYTVHTGSSKKFSSGWDQIFGGKPAEGKKSKPKAKAKSSASKAKKKKKDS
ncbi:MAG: hypothetical protein KDA78_11850 [Planctomycetaceae bacterium]|nr:hypothetical protein [Planctomycetaceae bacterium]